MNKGVKFIKDLGMLKPKEDSIRKSRYYLVKCLHCNEEFITRSDHFKNLESCKKCKYIIRPRITAGCCKIKHGLAKHPLYKRWKSMKYRCNNKSCPSYKNYGARGIKVCKEWENDFKLFFDWGIDHGFKKELQLDRINNNEDYSPENCRFVEPIINANNQRPLKENNKSGFRGVFKNVKGPNFVASIKTNGKTKHLGTFSTAEEAHEIYKKEFKIKKEKLNKGL